MSVLEVAERPAAVVRAVVRLVHVHGRVHAGRRRVGGRRDRRRDRPGGRETRGARTPGTRRDRARGIPLENGERLDIRGMRDETRPRPVSGVARTPRRARGVSPIRGGSRAARRAHRHRGRAAGGATAGGIVLTRKVCTVQPRSTRKSRECSVSERASFVFDTELDHDRRHTRPRRRGRARTHRRDGAPIPRRRHGRGARPANPLARVLPSPHLGLVRRSYRLATLLNSPAFARDLTVSRRPTLPPRRAGRRRVLRPRRVQALRGRVRRHGRRDGPRRPQRPHEDGTPRRAQTPKREILIPDSQRRVPTTPRGVPTRIPLCSSPHLPLPPSLSLSLSLLTSATSTSPARSPPCPAASTRWPPRAPRLWPPRRRWPARNAAKRAQLALDDAVAAEKRATPRNGGAGGRGARAGGRRAEDQRRKRPPWRFARGWPWIRRARTP